VKGLAQAARDHGAEVWTGTAVTGIDVRDGAVAGVQTDRGAVAAPVVVNAAGSWAGVVGAMAGVTVPVIPRRIQILLSEATEPVTELGWSGNGIYARQAVAGQLHFGSGGPAWDSVVQHWDKSVSGLTMQRTARNMVELMPGVRDVRILRSWAGVIGPTVDGDPILELCERPRGLLIASGFGGNGFCIGPGTGSVVADLILTGRTEVDISGLRLGRFAEQPAGVLDEFRNWWDSPDRQRDTGAWAVEGVRAES
jgi:sarcosine oxidase, subunit beta